MNIKKLQKVCKIQGRGPDIEDRLTLARLVRRKRYIPSEEKLLLSSFLCIINEAAAALVTNEPAAERERATNKKVTVKTVYLYPFRCINYDGHDIGILLSS